ncbi:MAG TPA: methyltransferase domain-containing protein [Terriglobia bacterium]|nr:methyltransferase domain-containing protein [Terriglobia bacterium]
MTPRQPSAQATAWNAGLYDSKHSFVWERGADLIELLKPAFGERILDLGCGTGHLTANIAESGAHVVGIDSSPEMIREAREHYPAIEFRIADARDFSFEEPFDAAFSNAALHWIKEAERVVQCLGKALKPGGRFVAELGGKGNVRELVNAFRRSLETMGYEKDPNPWYFPSVAEYSSLLERYGLEMTFAVLFNRPTLLEDGSNGMRNWINMFAASFLASVPPARNEEFIQNVEHLLRPRLFQDGRWIADYKRLRVIARKSFA